MKKHFIKVITSILTIVLISLAFTGCGQGVKNDAQQQIAEIKRGDINITVTADGNLEMPEQAVLNFDLAGDIRFVVKEGKEVKTGTLLAKIDDAQQTLAIMAAHYDLQLALSDLAETTPGCCTRFSIPIRYRNESAAISFRQAMQNVNLAQKLLSEMDYYNAAKQLHLSKYDFEFAIELLTFDIKKAETFPEIGSDYPVTIHSENEQWHSSPALNNAISLIQQDIEKLDTLLAQIENGNYSKAELDLIQLQTSLPETFGAIEKAVMQVGGFQIRYPDTITGLDFVVFAHENLKEVQQLMEQDNSDPVHLAELMRMAQHQLEISREILQNYEIVYQHGINLKVNQQYNLKINKAIVALQDAKRLLSHTEILAPFDGTVVEVNMRENEKIQSGISNLSEPPASIRLVNTKKVEMKGVVDEIDIMNVKVGQKAIIRLDAPIGDDLTGTVTYISPFGTEKSGIVNYDVTITLDPTDVDLKGGLTATASIIVDGKQNVLIIPNGAVQGTRGNYWAQVVIDQDKGQTEKRPITIGLQDGLYSEVISGLQEGEKVIVEATSRRSSGLF